MSTVQLLSLLAEFMVTVFALLIAVNKQKTYGWLIALTFAIYVIYDTTRFLSIPIAQDMLTALFFLASASILLAVWQIYRKLK
jgi:hypothetical protein